jgi:hypothetical protein
MKTLKFLLVVMVAGLTSCNPVRVVVDYDRQAQFGSYDTFAFYRPGIDESQISDLDKKRILRAIEAELVAKGLTKNESPELLVSFFTKEQQRVDVWNNGWGWGWGAGWGWGPGWGWGGPGGWGTMASTTTEGSLYIDLIDARNKELIWQGIGTASLITNGDMEKKEARIKEIVHEIMANYPPGSKD